MLVLNRVLFNRRDFRLVTMMFPPELMPTYSGSQTFTIRAYPILYLEHMPYVKPGEKRPDFTRFKITPKILHRTIELFRGLYRWFNDDQFRMLYTRDEENGRLLVNMDYRSLRYKIVGEPINDSMSNEILEAVPVATIPKEGGGECEGVGIWINTRQNYIEINYQEVEDILGILESFSFQNELLIYMESYRELLYKYRLEMLPIKEPMGKSYDPAAPRINPFGIQPKDASSVQETIKKIHTLGTSTQESLTTQEVPNQTETV